jgi:hypothetical protein
MVTDWGINTWPNSHPNIWINPLPPAQPLPAPTQHTYVLNQENISKKEFDDFKREFLEFKELVKRAIKYDADNNEPHCEVDSKVEIVRKVAAQLGVDMDDVFPRE